MISQSYHWLLGAQFVNEFNAKWVIDLVNLLKNIHGINRKKIYIDKVAISQGIIKTAACIFYVGNMETFGQLISLLAEDIIFNALHIRNILKLGTFCCTCNDYDLINKFREQAIGILMSKRNDWSFWRARKPWNTKDIFGQPILISARINALLKRK